MNERILELAEQAGLIAGNHDDYDFKKNLTTKERKFAELIVLECVNAVMDGTMSGDHYAMRIENHFDSGNGGILYFGDKK